MGFTQIRFLDFWHCVNQTSNLPIEVWFVFVHVYVVQRILSEPSVDSEPVLVRPFGNRWQCNGLKEEQL